MQGSVRPRKRPGTWFLGVFVLLGVLLAATSGCTLYSLDKRSAYTNNHPVVMEDGAFPRSLAAFGDGMVGGNRVDILNNGDAIVAGMLGAIQEAKASVDLESYIFKDDKAGKLFGDALIEAAKRGVEVRVLVDATGSSRSGALLSRLRAGGVKAEIFHPIRVWSLYKLGRRTHRKILVVDGTVSFTGGFCIAEPWLGDARNPKEWRDIMVRATGPVSAQMQAIFGEDWTYTTGEVLAGDKFYPHLAASGTVLAQGIKVARGDPSSLAALLYFLAIQSAQKSIHIQNAYFVPSTPIRRALLQAAKRGVDVRIMVPGKHIDVPVLRMASRFHYGELLQGGVHILEYNRTMLHAKDAVFDGVFSIVGSINFDARSLLENAEDSLAFYDRGFAARLEETFENDTKECREITFANWKKRGIHRRVVELFSGFFQPLY
jgi:cardiolipin synthase A/B